MTSLTAAAGELAQVCFGDALLRARNPQRLAEGSACLICVRPHDLRLLTVDVGANALTGIVRAVQWQGDLHSIALDVGGHELRLSCTPLSEPPSPGASLALSFSAADATLVPESDGG